MSRLLAAIVLFSAVGWINPVAAVTKASCDHDYDACKKKHIFDKKPCRKKRDNCFAILAQQTAQEQKAEVKRRMLDGTPQAQGPSMRDRANGSARPLTAAERKAQAKKRLLERQEANSATGSGMRDGVQAQ